MKPASFREARLYSTGRVDAAQIAQAASNARMKLRSAGDAQVLLAVRLNFWSFGEHVTVSLGSIHGRALIDITSTCVLPTQSLDWGKNERNVRKFFVELDSVLGGAHKHEPCHLCSSCGYLLAGIPSATCPECGSEFSGADGHSSQDAASWKSLTKFAVVLTGVETTAVIAIGYWAPSVLPPIGRLTVCAALGIFCINISAIAALFGLQRVVRGWLR